MKKMGTTTMPDNNRTRRPRTIHRIVAVLSIILFLTASANAEFESSSISPYSITLTWTAPGDDGASGVAAEYDIRYSTEPVTESNWDQCSRCEDGMAPQVAGSIESCTIEGLNPSTTYYFAIKTADEVPNWSPMSNVISRTTAADVTPPEVIADADAETGENVGEVTMSWTAPSDDAPSGLVASYVIGYSRSMIDSSNFNLVTFCESPPLPATAGTLQSCVITDLVPGEWYFVAIVSVDPAGNVSGLSNVDSALSYFSIVADVGDDEDELPGSYELSQNYPNPFNPSTTVEYALASAGRVKLEVYNVLGQLINVLVDEEKSAGSHSVQWNGDNSNGQSVATGVYIYRIEAGSYSETRKMVLTK